MASKQREAALATVAKLEDSYCVHDKRDHSDNASWVLAAVECNECLADALQRERDEAERECIRLVCWYCGNHDQAKRLKSGVIGHKKPDWQRGRRCEAAPIYELRRRHGERVEVGDE